MKIKNTVRMLAAVGIAAITLASVGCMEWPKDPVMSKVITRQAIDGLPSVTATSTAVGEAKVWAVDFDKRTVDLIDSNGKVTKYSVPEAVKNFPQIKKGDTVKVEYTETIEANLHKVNEPVKVVSGGFLATAPKGDKPGLLLYRTSESVCEVKAVNAAEHKVTLEGVSEKPVTLKVSELLPKFDEIKVGDKVVFTYTEALLINVVSPK